jgi:hypothetical protein
MRRKIIFRQKKNIKTLENVIDDTSHAGLQNDTDCTTIKKLKERFKINQFKVIQYWTLDVAQLSG